MGISRDGSSSIGVGWIALLLPRLTTAAKRAEIRKVDFIFVIRDTLDTLYHLTTLVDNALRLV